jgi:hypothetical protein
MTYQTIRQLTICALSIWALMGCQTTNKGLEPLDELANGEGLVRVESKAVDVLYKRPEASLAGYSKLMLTPIEVQFAKHWTPESSNSTLYNMHSVDREKIKSDLANAFAEVFTRDMQKGGYPIVSEAGPDVLEMQAAIANLYITAPDPSQLTGRTEIYTTDAGEMTLIMQLHDSITGQILARAIDRRGASNDYWNWTTSASNTADAKRIISGWSTSLRKAFDASRGEGSEPLPPVASSK